MYRLVLASSTLLAVLFSGCSQEHSDPVASGPAIAAAQTQPTATATVTDLHNTVCPVGGDKVGDSKLTETYQGKIYHFCCDDCPEKFKKDPEKYAKEVAANPAKYGIK